MRSPPPEAGRKTVLSASRCPAAHGFSRRRTSAHTISDESPATRTYPATDWSRAWVFSWQQGPLGRDPNGTFLTATPMPERVLYLEPLRRRMSVELGGRIIARSDEEVLLFEPAHGLMRRPRG